MTISGGRWTGPIWDTHIHLDLEARGLSAARDFANAGGTHICLVHKPGFSSSLPESIEQVDEAYLQTLDLAKSVRKNVGLNVHVILGPHPVVWEKQVHSMGMELATQLHLDSVELALNYCAEGQAVALGEVGRPHYPVSEEIWSAANIQLETVMQMASRAGFPIQLHVEDNGSTTNAELASICDRAGLNRKRAVHHYASANVSEQFTHGLSSSVSMGKNSVVELIDSFECCKSSWTMETDYLDDPKRPGAVLGPKTVPKRTQNLASELLTILSQNEVEELLSHVHSVWPNQLYGQIDP
ncbi:MAG: metal-dependent hydrolase [Euryarchaeota archaeon]|nr:metal-dependent hydrolase [Euryarchaeota archaeon]|tara:strand:+ start:1841 stop:2734 length:894 start_codon:yes stop_codon:yes gene_type:complete